MHSESHQRVLEHRAELLARLAEPEDDTQAFAQLVVLPIADERYAIDATAVGAVDLATSVTPVPDSPDGWDGVTCLHGETYGVLDLNRRLCLGTRTWTPAATVVVRGRTTFALLCSDVPYLIRADKTEIGEPLHAEVGAAGLVRDTAGNPVTMLDIDGLLDFDESGGRK